MKFTTSMAIRQRCCLKTFVMVDCFVRCEKALVATMDQMKTRIQTFNNVWFSKIANVNKKNIEREKAFCSSKSCCHQN